MAEIPVTADSYMIHTLQRHREILNVKTDCLDTISQQMSLFVLFSRATSKNTTKFRQITQRVLSVKSCYVAREYQQAQADLVGVICT